MNYGTGLQSLQMRARWARALLVAFMVFEGARWLLRLAIATDTIPFYYTINYAPEIRLAGYVAVALFVANAVALLAWTYRAWKNIELLNLRGLNFTAGWAVGSFLVPVINFAVPFQAMRELYNRSTGEDESQAAESVADVTSWWACFLGGTFVGGFIALSGVLFRYTNIMFVAHPLVWIATDAFGAAMTLAAAFFMRRVIQTITDAQSSSAGVVETFA